MQLAHPKAAPYINTGAAMCERGQFAAAIEALTNGITRDPNHAVAHVYRAYAYMMVGDLQAMNADLIRARELDPKDADMHYDIAKILVRCQAFIVAIGALDRAIALRPNFEDMFSPRSVVELAKALVKFLFIALVAGCLLWKNSGELMGLGAEPINAGLMHAARLVGHAFLILAGTLGLIAAVDVPYQLWQHNQKLKMSREEIKEEMKEADGSPEMKGRIRRTQQEMARRRMMQEVPKADVVVTNPTHFAVALRYDEKRMRAPLVVAKGADVIAARIREIATESNVAIFEAPPLARALHRNVEIGDEIPSNLYVAVAQVLTYIYQVKNARRYGAVMPQRPAIDPGLDSAAKKH